MRGRALHFALARLFIFLSFCHAGSDELGGGGGGHPNGLIFEVLVKQFKQEGSQFFSYAYRGVYSSSWITAS